MTSVQYTRFWMTNTVTLDQIGCYSAPDRDQSHTVKGEVRTYAGGRQRAVGSIGSASTWRVTLLELTLAQVETLKAWQSQGVTVFARDHRGQALYATYFEVGVGENASQTVGAATYSVAVVLQRVDVVEGV